MLYDSHGLEVTAADVWDEPEFKCATCHRHLRWDAPDEWPIHLDPDTGDEIDTDCYPEPYEV